MKTYINDTIKEIISVVLQFKTDIKNNNSDGIKKFIINFRDLLKRFKSLTHGSEIDFEEEFSDLFNYLFVIGKIYEEAGNLIDEGIRGTIIAIKKNGNPLSGKLTISPDRNLFEDFVKKYQRLSHNKKTGRTPITTLKDACNGPGNFEAITNWFSQKGYCDPDTFYWNNRLYPLNVLASYLKVLHNKGYTQKLRHLDVQAIAKNSFNAEMSIDTIKSAKTVTADLPHAL